MSLYITLLYSPSFLVVVSSRRTVVGEHAEIHHDECNNCGSVFVSQLLISDEGEKRRDGRMERFS